MQYSVVIPALNEERTIARCLQHARSVLPGAEFIVVDGGSADATCSAAAAAGAVVLSHSAGRGGQCNAGANAARGNILLFLHADTLLPPSTATVLTAAFADSTVQIGTFRLQFDRTTALLRLYSACTRFDSLFTRFGDQCIVVRRSLFDALDGFPDWPLFEDVHFLRLARRRTTVHSFPASVTTSARRFTQDGIVRRQVRNGLLICQYLLGVPADRLAQRYARPGSAPSVVHVQQQ